MRNVSEMKLKKLQDRCNRAVPTTHKTLNFNEKKRNNGGGGGLQCM